MEAFKNEFGDVIGWRVALAGILATALASGLGYGLVTFVHAMPARDAASPVHETVATRLDELGDRFATTDEEVGVPTTPTGPDDATDNDAYASVSPGDTLQGTEHLEGLNADEQAALEAALRSWADEHADLSTYTLTVTDVPQVTPEQTRVGVRLVSATATLDITASLAQGGSWQVFEHTDTPVDETMPQDVAAPIALTDTERLGQVMEASVARELSRQMAASGIAGSAEAWTTPDTIVCEGDVTRLVVWVPQEAADPVRYEASYDAGIGLLALEPAPTEDL